MTRPCSTQVFPRRRSSCTFSSCVQTVPLSAAAAPRLTRQGAANCAQIKTCRTLRCRTHQARLGRAARAAIVDRHHGWPLKSSWLSKCMRRKVTCTPASRLRRTALPKWEACFQILLFASQNSYCCPAVRAVPSMPLCAVWHQHSETIRQACVLMSLSAHTATEQLALLACGARSTGTAGNLTAEPAKSDSGGTYSRKRHTADSGTIGRLAVYAQRFGVVFDRAKTEHGFRAQRKRTNARRTQSATTEDVRFCQWRNGRSVHNSTG